jgi:hypothetical protein
MINGLLAALSPNEESTLRVIAQGRVHAKSLRDNDVSRFKRLGLIEECRTGLALSATGQQRLGAVPLAPTIDLGATR